MPVGWAACHGNASQASDAVGTARQIEEAHKALDGAGVSPGCLAVRVVELVRDVDAALSTLERALRP